MIKKVLFRNDKKYYWSEGDLSTSSGIVKEKDLKNCEDKVKAHSGKEFDVMSANFMDSVEKIKRGVQAIMEKDIGVMLVNAGVGKDSVVLDAGTGSGKLAAFLGRFCKKVYSYDIDEGSINLANKNFEFLNINNVEVKLKDIYKGIDEKNLDAIFLDVTHPWKALGNVAKALKNGGSLVVYVPTISQVIEFEREVKNFKFIKVKIIELLEREWYSEGLKVRPKSQMQGHTAFLCFYRKV